ncbi:hypothetical protein B0H13DRAFT_2453608 [Mycena leptocephala]|nr:hypothetical protein B0H13DRAFT_2453608 [Mycena leptocephala]
MSLCLCPGAIECGELSAHRLEERVNLGVYRWADEIQDAGDDDAGRQMSGWLFGTSNGADALNELEFEHTAQRDACAEKRACRDKVDDVSARLKRREDSSTSSSVRAVTKTHAEKRRVILISLAIGLGIPLLQISLPETYETPLAVALFHLPPSPSAPFPLSNVVRPLSLFPLYTPLTHLSFFVVLSIKSFYNSRSQFRLLLSAFAHANLNLNRYLRLMALASADLLLTVPIT